MSTFSFSSELSELSELNVSSDSVDFLAGDKLLAGEELLADEDLCLSNINNFFYKYFYQKY